MTATPALPDWPYPRWIAHRGGGLLAPENTLPAFELGLRLGYRMAECDVKLAADGVPYLLHDDSLDRTTSGRGPGDALTWPELARLDAGSWHGRGDFAGTPPARLDEVMHLMAAGGATLNLEIKPMPGLAHATGAAVAHAVQALIAQGWGGGRVEPPLLSSFEPAALAGAREAARALPRALLLEQPSEAGLDQAVQLGCVAVVGDHTGIDAAFVAAAHRRHLAVACYTVNDEDEAERLLALGVAGIITDAIDRLGP